MSASPHSSPTQRVRLTALELHPDGSRVRVRHLAYEGSAYYGPALAALLPELRPVRRLDFERLPEEEGVRQVRAVWVFEGDGLDSSGGGWHGARDLPAEVQAHAELALAAEPDDRPHWQRRGGWEALLAWLDAELEAQGRERLGVPQVLKDWGISFLARAATTGGPVYLKAVPDFFAAEVRVTCALQQEGPGAAAPLLAADTPRGLMLLSDAGVPLVSGGSEWSSPAAGAPLLTPADSRALMKHLAQIQRASEGLPLLADLPDHDPEWMRAWLPHLLGGDLFLTGQPGGLTPEEATRLQAMRGRLEGALNRLAASPVPCTLGHGDLHEGNVVRRPDGRFTLLDWSDASRTHPFLDGGPQYLVPEAQRSQAADDYLHAWADLLPLPQLRSLLADGTLAGELYRALGYVEGILPHIAADDRDWDGAYLYHFRALLRLAGPP